MSEMVERVAKAIEGAFGHQPYPALRIDVARAAMAAMREPTEAMLAVAVPFTAAELGVVWRAMVDEALR